MKNKEIELTIIACSFKNNFTLFTSPGSIIYIMLKKIILPVILLIFTQQELYGTEKHDEIKEVEKLDPPTKEDPWESINSWVNRNESGEKKYPKLWLLWTIFDNVTFQYGNSKRWKHGEAYYGLSNGIGFFPSALNFGWMKVGIVDAHINVINTIIKYMKTYTAIKYDYYYRQNDESRKKHENPVWLNSLKWWLFYTVVTDIHLFSFKFFNCVKIKIISLGALITDKINRNLLDDYDDSWYFFFDVFNEQLTVPGDYFILSPRIELNIPGIIDLF